MLAAGAHPLPRHGLVRLSPSGWDQVRAGTWCDSAAACLTHWASHDLPLVVTRQRAAQAEALICLGLPAPQRWGRQRLALQVEAQQLTQASAFPPAASLQPLLAARQHAPWRVVCAQWAALGVCVRVHGSYGWHWLTGLDHLHAGSDLDLLLTVRSAEIIPYSVDATKPMDSVRRWFSPICRVAVFSWSTRLMICSACS